jgi:predicted RNase H-like nuclease (RuvC/YqgF family)
MAKKSGNNLLFWIVVGVLGFFAYNHLLKGNQSSPIAYAEEFKKTLIKFEEKSNETKREVKKALEAYDEAKDVLFKYQDERTQKFIREWRSAEKKVNDLIRSYNELVRKANDFFSVLYREAESIKDQRLRSQVVSYIDERREAFYRKLVRAKEGIEQLKELMERGNDLIKAVEIAGALRYSEIGKYDFDQFHRQLNASFEELNSLIQEGKSLLGTLSDNKIKAGD